MGDVIPGPSPPIRTRVLEEGPTTPVKQPDLVLFEGLYAWRVVMRGQLNVCDESPDTCWRAVSFFKQIKAAVLPDVFSIAHIGGGMCVLPYLVSSSSMSAVQSVYEIEQGLAEFCPATFVPGDWHSTLVGTFDVVVYDLGNPTPDLAAHLNQGGVVISQP